MAADGETHRRFLRLDLAHLTADPHTHHDSDAVYIDRIPLIAQKRGLGSSVDDDGPRPIHDSARLTAPSDIVAIRPFASPIRDDLLSPPIRVFIEQQRLLL